MQLPYRFVCVSRCASSPFERNTQKKNLLLVAMLQWSISLSWLHPIQEKERGDATSVCWSSAVRVCWPLYSTRRCEAAKNEEWENNVSQNREHCSLFMTVQRLIGIVSLVWRNVTHARTPVSGERDTYGGFKVAVQMIKGSAHKLKIVRGRSEHIWKRHCSLSVYQTVQCGHL